MSILTKKSYKTVDPEIREDGSLFYWCKICHKETEPKDYIDEVRACKACFKPFMHDESSLTLQNEPQEVIVAKNKLTVRELLKILTDQPMDWEIVIRNSKGLRVPKASINVREPERLGVLYG